LIQRFNTFRRQVIVKQRTNAGSDIEAIYSAAISVEKYQASGKHCVLLTNFLLGR